MKAAAASLRLWLVGGTILLCGCLGACGGGNDPSSPTLASLSDVEFVASTPGPTPFIAFVQLQGDSLASITNIAYVIEGKPGTASKPVSVSYTAGALQSRGYVASGAAKVPVFGLYAGYTNPVTISLTFKDGSVATQQLSIAAASYVDPNGIYDHPTILQARPVGSVLGFDFFAMKSAYGTPVIVDSDGNIRWVGVGDANSQGTVFQNNGFIVGDPASSQFSRQELDGSVTSVPLVASNLLGFTHNIDRGKNGFVGEFITNAEVESTAAEFSSTGAILQTWDFGALLSAYMQSQGDDPRTFVRPGADWFHMNSTVYDPSDDSLIVSSRENFVIKVDYSTGNIIWILGDPTKYWYTFPSLRAKALRLTNGLYPVGQHALSITSDGLLMLFNDGEGSVSQPTGAPGGVFRSYSAVSAYLIDRVAMTASEAWDFDYGQSLFSPFCSSAYEASGQSVLVDYAMANNGKTAHLVGLNAAHDVVFDITYSTTLCNTSWNAVPIPLDNMQFQ